MGVQTHRVIKDTPQAASYTEQTEQGGPQIESNQEANAVGGVSPTVGNRIEQPQSPDVKGPQTSPARSDQRQNTPVPYNRSVTDTTSGPTLNDTRGGPVGGPLKPSPAAGENSHKDLHVRRKPPQP